MPTIASPRFQLLLLHPAGADGQQVALFGARVFESRAADALPNLGQVTECSLDNCYYYVTLERSIGHFQGAFMDNLSARQSPC